MSLEPKSDANGASAARGGGAGSNSGAAMEQITAEAATIPQGFGDLKSFIDAGLDVRGIVPGGARPEAIMAQVRSYISASPENCRASIGYLMHEDTDKEFLTRMSTYESSSENSSGTTYAKQLGRNYFQNKSKLLAYALDQVDWVDEKNFGLRDELLKMLEGIDNLYSRPVNKTDEYFLEEWTPENKNPGFGKFQKKWNQTAVLSAFYDSFAERLPYILGSFDIPYMIGKYQKKNIIDAIGLLKPGFSGRRLINKVASLSYVFPDILRGNGEKTKLQDLLEAVLRPDLSIDPSQNEYLYEAYIRAGFRLGIPIVEGISPAREFEIYKEPPSLGKILRILGETNQSTAYLDAVIELEALFHNLTFDDQDLGENSLNALTGLLGLQVGREDSIKSRLAQPVEVYSGKYGSRISLESAVYHFQGRAWEMMVEYILTHPDSDIAKRITNENLLIGNALDFFCQPVPYRSELEKIPRDKYYLIRNRVSPSEDDKEILRRAEVQKEYLKAKRRFIECYLKPLDKVKRRDFVQNGKVQDLLNISQPQTGSSISIQEIKRDISWLDNQEAEEDTQVVERLFPNS